MMRCDDATLLLGSYSLGGLEREETLAVEAHLSACAGCREAFERIAALPPLLDTLRSTPAIDASPSPELEGAVLAGFAAQGGRARGSRWPMAAAALAGSAATIAVLALAGAFSSDRADETRLTLVAPAGGAAATAQARLVSTNAGTAIELDADLPKLQEGEVYELWFAGAKGVVSAGTFTVDRHGWAEVRLTTAARPGPYERIGITREPDAFDPARNGPGVAGVALPR
jgi:anti-sigma factor RsiW